MKKYLVITLALLVNFAFASLPDSDPTTDKAAATATINWMTLEEAVAAQKTNPKKIIIDAYTDWCGPCKMLDKKTFHNADVVKYINDNFYAVKFDAEGNETIKFKGKTFTNPNYDPAKDLKRNSSHQLSAYFQVRAYPTIIFLDNNADLVLPLRGYQTPQQLELYLKLIAKEDYKVINTKEKWEAYQKDFKPTFQE
ncbi:MAG: thioredoxin family protein [Flavobacteriales bacterium]|nr:MAG: thioredoxin family protein [Flavobacteriales bacterium]